MSVWTIVVAAGSGTRFGGPKQLARLGDQRVIDWSVAAAQAASDHVVVVVPDALVAELGASLADDVAAVAGGASRSDSVRAGLHVVGDDAEIIVVHDGARPLASVALWERTIEAVRAGAAGAIPVVPVTDTIRHTEGGVIDRDMLVAVQTPQAFGADALRSAHARGDAATDDAGLVEAFGGSIAHVDGSPDNLKITNPNDLAVAEILMEAR